MKSNIQILTLFLGSVLVAGCMERESAPQSERPAVIVISIDTLRADRLPMYGYEHGHTPAMEAFRRDAVLFENAFTHSPLTLPSHATMFTGRLPSGTGIRDNVGYVMNAEIPTLAEVLGAKGYATGAAVSAYTLREETGIGRGFAFFDDDIEVPHMDAGLGRLQRPGTETINAAKEWISSKRSDPFFFVLHLYEPHTPYEPIPPFDAIEDKYDGEVATADSLVGTFIDFLKEEGVYDDALIIITSDHGEGLGDHGEDEHGIFLYREAIHVPLLVKFPESDRKRTTVRTAVQLSDIFPTILEAAGISDEPFVLDGTTLTEFFEDEDRHRRVFSETWYPRFHFGWSELHSLTDGRYHLIESPSPELYDMKTDPGETQNRIEQERRVFHELRSAMQPLIATAEAPDAIDPEQARKLASLGYLATAVNPAEMERDLPSPRDEIGVFGEMNEAFEIMRSGDHESAVRAFDRLLSKNPMMLDVWEVKVRALERLGRKEEAIHTAKEALVLHPRSASLAIQVAALSMEVGRIDDAAAHAELAIQSFPAQAFDMLARIELAKGNLDQARVHALRSLESKNDRAMTLVTLGNIEKESDNLEAALRHYNQAALIIVEGKKQPIPGLHYFRGDVLARLGYEAEAERAFRAEVKLYPTDPRAYRGLILLYVAQERTEEASQAIHSFVTSVPTARAYAIVIDMMRMFGDRQAERYWSERALRKFAAEEIEPRLLIAANESSVMKGGS